jgi:hypothetical protein
MFPQNMKPRKYSIKNVYKIRTWRHGSNSRVPGFMHEALSSSSSIVKRKRRKEKMKLNKFEKFHIPLLEIYNSTDEVLTCLTSKQPF